MQNTSHAVMAQRAELKNSLDDFPTPPWATRALVEHVVASREQLSSMTCLEPACGRGHMSVALAGYFREVASSDVFDYGFGHVADFLKSNHPEGAYDWIITNPPFRLGEDFIGRAMKIARRGVALSCTRSTKAKSKNECIPLQGAVTENSRFSQAVQRYALRCGLAIA